MREDNEFMTFYKLDHGSINNLELAYPAHNHTKTRSNRVTFLPVGKTIQNNISFREMFTNSW